MAKNLKEIGFLFGIFPKIILAGSNADIPLLPEGGWYRLGCRYQKRHNPLPLNFAFFKAKFNIR